MRRTVLALAGSLAAPCLQAADGALDAWKAYAQQAMSPAYAWAAPAVIPPSVFDQPRERLLADSETVLSASPVRLTALRFASGTGRNGFEVAQQSPWAIPQAAFSAAYTEATLIQPIGSASAFNVTAIVAEQRFATPGFGSSPWQGQAQPLGVVAGSNPETSTGSGVRLAFVHRLGGQVDWNLTLQSQLEMDAFNSYRGIYSEAGDFDAPGFVQTGLGWAPMARLEFSLNLQQVFFSEVDTFTSSSLPVRFLSLLGDRNSPEFAWRDQTVLSLEAAHATTTGGRWSLRYSTQQQPRPTAMILDRALSDQYSNLNLALGYQQSINRYGRLRFAASYSPSSSFLGTSPYVQREFDGGSQVEFDAQWMLTF